MQAKIWNNSDHLRVKNSIAQILLEDLNQDYTGCKRSSGTQKPSLLKPSHKVNAFSNALAYQRGLPT